MLLSCSRHLFIFFSCSFLYSHSPCWIVLLASCAHVTPLRIQKQCLQGPARVLLPRLVFPHASFCFHFCFIFLVFHFSHQTPCLSLSPNTRSRVDASRSLPLVRLSANGALVRRTRTVAARVALSLSLSLVFIYSNPFLACFFSCHFRLCSGNCMFF